MKIEVLQRHIDASPSTTSNTECPIALALKELGYGGISVGGMSVTIGVKDYTFQIERKDMDNFLCNPTPRTFNLRKRPVRKIA